MSNAPRFTADEYEKLVTRMKGPAPTRPAPKKRRAPAPTAAKPGALDKRNATELAYADHLFRRLAAREIRHFQFEPVKLRLGKDHKTTYTPDYLVWTAGGQLELHEVKGHWEDDARVKIKTAARLFPMFRFVAVQKKGKGWTYESF